MNTSNELRYRLIDTPSGWFGMVARGDALCATFLPAPKRVNSGLIRERHPQAREDLELLPSFARQVRDYFDGRARRFDPKIDVTECPPFHRKVYEACRRIPPGKTAGYRDLARAAGSENAARAVGNAMAHNPLPLVVPCHRVLRADGSIGGFSSPQGVEQKRRMLRLEGVELRGHQVRTPRSQPLKRAVKQGIMT